MSNLETKFEETNDPAEDAGCEDEDKCCKVIEIRLGMKLIIIYLALIFTVRILDGVIGLFGNSSFFGNLLLCAAVGVGLFGFTKAFPLIKDDVQGNRVQAVEGFKFVLFSFLAQALVLLLGTFMINVTVFGERANKNISGWFFMDLILCAVQYYFWKVSQRYEKY